MSKAQSIIIDADSYDAALRKADRELNKGKKRRMYNTTTVTRIKKGTYRVFYERR